LAGTLVPANFFLTNFFGSFADRESRSSQHPRYRFTRADFEKAYIATKRRDNLHPARA